MKFVSLPKIKIGFIKKINITNFFEFIKKYFVWVVFIFAFIILSVFILNLFIVLSNKKQIVSIENSNYIEETDCIFVLGAGIWGDRPSPILEDRLKTAIELYKNGVAKKIIMTGDHGRKKYDEVNLMKDYAIKSGVPSEDIFMDHAGFSTYDSIYRAKKIFNVNSMIIVTQKFHLYRALYTSKKFDIKSYGVPADLRNYVNIEYLEARECIARYQYFFKTIIKPKPKYLGTVIPVTGNGDVTNDR